MRDTVRTWPDEVSPDFRAAVEIFEALSDVGWQGGTFYGELQYSPEWEDRLQRIAAQGASLKYGGDTLPLSRILEQEAEVVIRVEFSPLNRANDIFVRTLDDLLRAPKFRVSSPRCLYIADERVLYPIDSSPSLSAYHESVEFVKLLSGVADHSDLESPNPHLVLLYSDSKIEIPIDYQLEHIAGLTGVEELSTELSQQPHLSVKRGIFKGGIREICGAQPERDRFSTLSRQFVELKKRYKNGLELYLREFSFESKREELERLKREYLAKINDAVDNIHARLIALPAAVVIVANQLRPASSIPDLVHNSVVLLGALVFAYLMWMVAENQGHHLSAVWSDIRLREDRMRQTVPQFHAENRHVFKELRERYDHQRNLLGWVRGMIIVGLVVALFVYVLYLPGSAASQSQIFVPL